MSGRFTKRHQPQRDGVVSTSNCADALKACRKLSFEEALEVAESLGWNNFSATPVSSSSLSPALPVHGKRKFEASEVSPTPKGPSTSIFGGFVGNIASGLSVLFGGQDTKISGPLESYRPPVEDKIDSGGGATSDGGFIFLESASLQGKASVIAKKDKSIQKYLNKLFSSNSKDAGACRKSFNNATEDAMHKFLKFLQDEKIHDKSLTDQTAFCYGVINTFSAVGLQDCLTLAIIEVSSLQAESTRLKLEACQGKKRYADLVQTLLESPEKFANSLLEELNMLRENATFLSATLLGSNMSLMDRKGLFSISAAAGFSSYEEGLLAMFSGNISLPDVTAKALSNEKLSAMKAYDSREKIFRILAAANVKLNITGVLAAASLTTRGGGTIKTVLTCALSLAAVLGGLSNRMTSLFSQLGLVVSPGTALDILKRVASQRLIEQKALILGEMSGHTGLPGSMSTMFVYDNFVVVNFQGNKTAGEKNYVTQGVSGSILALSIYLSSDFKQGLAAPPAYPPVTQQSILAFKPFLNEAKTRGSIGVAAAVADETRRNLGGPDVRLNHHTALQPASGRTSSGYDNMSDVIVGIAQVLSGNFRRKSQEMQATFIKMDQEPAHLVHQVAMTQPELVRDMVITPPPFHDLQWALTYILEQPLLMMLSLGHFLNATEFRNKSFKGISQKLIKKILGGGGHQAAMDLVAQAAEEWEEDENDGNNLEAGAAAAAVPRAAAAVAPPAAQVRQAQLPSTSRIVALVQTCKASSMFLPAHNKAVLDQGIKTAACREKLLAESPTFGIGSMTQDITIRTKCAKHLLEQFLAAYRLLERDHPQLVAAPAAGSPWSLFTLWHEMVTIELLPPIVNYNKIVVDGDIVPYLDNLANQCFLWASYGKHPKHMLHSLETLLVVKHFLEKRPDILKTMAIQGKKFDEVFVEMHHSMLEGLLSSLGMASTYQTICFVTALVKTLPTVSTSLRKILATMGIAGGDGEELAERTEEDALRKTPTLKGERQSSISNLSESAAQAAMHSTKGAHADAALVMAGEMADEIVSLKRVTEEHLLQQGLTQNQVDVLKAYDPISNGHKAANLFVDYMASRVGEVIKENNAKKVDETKGELHWWIEQQLCDTIKGICLRLREKQCAHKRHLVTTLACGTVLETMRPCIIQFLRAGPGPSQFSDTPAGNKLAVEWLIKLCNEFRTAKAGLERGQEFSLPYAICDYREAIKTQMDHASMYQRALAEAEATLDKRYNNKFKSLSACETLL